MSKHETFMDWISNHAYVIVSFERTIDPNGSHGFEALTIRMKIPLYNTMTKRHFEYIPDNDVLIDMLDKMYTELLSSSLSH